MIDLNVLEVFAGAGGLSLGLERAGFAHQGVVEAAPCACETLRANRPDWPIISTDVRDLSGRDYVGVDLLAAGGVPLSSSKIGNGRPDVAMKHEMFREVLRLVQEARPAALMLEMAASGLGLDRVAHCEKMIDELCRLGYTSEWQVLNALDYGLPQSRHRLFLVAVKESLSRRFRWPEKRSRQGSVGDSLSDLMSANGWQGADAWKRRAAGTAPSMISVGRRHGQASVRMGRDPWARIALDSSGIADLAPAANDPMNLMPRLTVSMAARMQGFPDDWCFCGRKFEVHWQVCNASLPPMAEAVGSAIANALVSLTTRSLPTSRHSVRNRKSVPIRVQKAIIARDGGQCRFPRCTQGRLVTETTEGEWGFTGKIAHIRAVSAGGPRYDPAFTQAMLNASSNLLVMCPQHHDEIDLHNPEKYPVYLLQSWLAAERESLAERIIRSLRIA